MTKREIEKLLNEFSQNFYTIYSLMSDYEERQKSVKRNLEIFKILMELGEENE